MLKSRNCRRGSVSRIAEHASYAGVRSRVTATRDIGLRVVDVESGVSVQNVRVVHECVHANDGWMQVAETTNDFFSKRKHEP